MRYLKTFEEMEESDYPDLDRELREKGEKTALSNFPHLQKAKAEQEEKRRKRSEVEDPDVMYSRNDPRYDEPEHKGGWQDGMGKQPWLENKNYNYK